MSLLVHLGAQVHTAAAAGSVAVNKQQSLVSCCGVVCCTYPGHLFDILFPIQMQPVNVTVELPSCLNSSPAITCLCQILLINFAAGFLGTGSIDQQTCDC